MDRDQTADTGAGSAPAMPPDLTPQEVAAARARQRAVIAESVRRKLIPEINPWTHTLARMANQPPHAVTNGVPATRRFALEHVRRVPVVLSDAARALIARSSHEGRLYPLALEEAFGTIAGVERVEIDVVPKRHHFSVADDERHPVTGEAPCLLVYTVYHVIHPAIAPHRYFTNAWDLSDLDPHTHLPAFHAWAMAAELARLYPYRADA